MELQNILREYISSKEHATLSDEQFFNLNEDIKNKQITTKERLIYKINLYLTENNKFNYYHY